MSAYHRPGPSLSGTITTDLPANARQSALAADFETSAPSQRVFRNQYWIGNSQANRIGFRVFQFFRLVHVQPGHESVSSAMNARQRRLELTRYGFEKRTDRIEQCLGCAHVDGVADTREGDADETVVE